MKTFFVRVSGLLLLCLLHLQPACAQLSAGGEPLAFGLLLPPLPAATRLYLPPAPADETSARRGEKARLPFMQAGELLETRAGPAVSGTWQELPGGGRLWRQQFTVQGAGAVSLYFSRYQLAQGATLFAYTPDGRAVLGAFTAGNNKKEGRFAIGLLPGETVVLELFEPAAARGKSLLQLEAIGAAWPQKPGKEPTARGFGDAGSCQVNINCSEADTWQNIENAVVRILIRNRNAIGWCTGSLVNNTRRDFTPYLLTAQHCGLNNFSGNLIPQSDFDQWIFYFEYEAENCNGPASDFGLEQRSVIGAAPLAHSDDEGGDTGSDFLLLLLSEAVPADWEPVFAGWSVENVASPFGVTIHHPEGDLKKIATYTHAPASGEFGEDVPDTHWLVNWASTANGHGVTEAGSSGAPLFDNGGRITGLLTGGSASCGRPNATDFFGKMYWSWDKNGSLPQNRLKDWLDPDFTGVTLLNASSYSQNVITALPDEAFPRPARVQVWPNPATSCLNVAMGQAKQVNQQRFRLLSLAGSEVAILKPLGQGAEAVELPLPVLKPGLYLLEVQTTSTITRIKIQIAP